MKKVLFFSLLFFVLPIFAKEQHFFTKRGEFIIPGSSIDNPADTGKKMHTYLVLFKPNKPAGSNAVLPGGETPASIACVYGLTTQVPGCPINGTTEVPTGGWGAVAVVDAYDNPFVEADLAVFSNEFHLKPCTTANGCFNVVYQNGVQPPFSDAWADEHDLDVEWIHAMAPNAKLYLVETQSESTADLFAGVQIASALVASQGGGVESNSWGSAEFSGEQSYDSYFQTPGVVYFASSGDYSAPARYPGSSPFIVSAGGSRIDRNSQGMLVGESAWSTRAGVPIGQKSGGTGGPSLYEPRPSYQNIVQKIVGSARGTPDISFDSDPATGVDVYSGYRGQWFVDGGTSAASPALAGIINSANHRASSTQQELAYIYGNYTKHYHQYWHDILIGNNGFQSMPGYDFVTGLGSPLTYNGK